MSCSHRNVIIIMSLLSSGWVWRTSCALRGNRDRACRSLCSGNKTTASSSAHSCNNCRAWTRSVTHIHTRVTVNSGSAFLFRNDLKSLCAVQFDLQNWVVYDYQTHANKNLEIAFWWQVDLNSGFNSWYRFRSLVVRVPIFPLMYQKY